MTKTLTDNSFFEEKVAIRIKHLPDKENISVLDCFAGKSCLWKEVGKRTNKKIEYVGIEKEKQKNYKCICGDNLKVIPILDLSQFDIIDVDAYGVPNKQMILISKAGYKGTVFFTSILVGFRSQPHDVLLANGISKESARKCVSIYVSHYREMFLYFLSTLFSSHVIRYIEPHRDKLYGVIKPKAE